MNCLSLFHHLLDHSLHDFIVLLANMRGGWRGGRGERIFFTRASSLFIMCSSFFKGVVHHVLILSPSVLHHVVKVPLRFVISFSSCQPGRFLLVYRVYGALGFRVYSLDAE